MLSTVTSKGQITIPKKIRDKLKLRTGDKVELALIGDNEISIKPVSKTVDEVYGILHDSKSGTYTVNHMKQAIAKKIAEKF